MSRIGRLLVVVSIVVGISLAYVVDAQQAPRAPQTPPGPQAPAGPPGGESAFPNIPNYYLLGMEQVQKELNLSEKQQEQIERLNEAYSQETQQELQTLRELPPQQRQQRLAEAQQRALKRVERLRQRLEGVLTKEQLQQLNDIGFQMAVSTALNNPRILQELNVTERQQQQLEDVRQKTQERLFEAEQNMAKESLQILTPEQQKTLRQMSQQESR